MLSEDHIRNIISSHSKTIGLVDHQIKSYENFLVHGIEATVSENIIRVGSYKVEFSDVHIPKPTVTEHDRKVRDLIPSEARARDLTYESPVYVNVKVSEYGEDETITNTNTHHRVEICKVPIMLRTKFCHLEGATREMRVKMKECEYDNGGYFVIKGNERVIVSQLRSSYNVILVFDGVSDKHELTAETRSMSESTGHSVNVKVHLGEDNRSIKFMLPHVKEPIPAAIVFAVFGYTTADEISKLIDLDCEEVRKYIRFMIRDGYVEGGRGDACKYIGERALYPVKVTDLESYGNQVVNVETLPHMGASSTPKAKALFFGHMIHKLLATKLGMRIPDDRDDYANKRVETTGILCNELFGQLFKKFKDSFVCAVEKKKKGTVDIVSLISRNNTITVGLRHCFSSGNWGVPKTSYTRPGVSQILSRLSYGATLSHCRRIAIPVGKEVKNAKIRQINSTQIMYVCPCETPEGQPVGIVLNLTMMARVSERTPTYLVRQVVEKCEAFVDIDEDSSEDNDTKVFVNGILIGFSYDPDEMCEEMRKARSSGVLPFDVSIGYNDSDQEIYISSDAGRLIRPVFNIKDDKLTLSEEDGTDWNTLFDNNKVTYLDNMEINNKVITFNQNEIGKYKADHCEVSPSMILGVMGSIIPWPDHSQSPRNCYQTSMGKQAMSMYALSFKHRTDTVSHVLGYPQRPIVSTHQSGLMGFNEMPSGVNAIVAIACYTGFNQEDSVIINKSAIDRGLFGATSYRTHTDREKKHGIYSAEKIGCPPLDNRKMDASYALLGDDGIVMERFPSGGAVYVNRGDVIVGKYFVDSSKGESEIVNDTSLVIKKGEEGYIDRVIKTITPDGDFMVKVVIRTDRTPEVGDKFASRAAQKGTCGMQYRQEDMPFTAEGIVPDIIINPHCIPSRMTINQLMESVLGKACVLSGDFGDATPFVGKDNEDLGQQICDKLGLHGYERTGKEVLMNGMTGEAMGSYFIGPVYYQRLKHLVSEKIHARASGPVTTLTRQPLEGRSRDGGLRFGEMERDAMISHGNSMFLKERLCDQSDPYKAPICAECGNISTTKTKCLTCGNDKISMVGIPYASKLVLQELNAMCIKTKISVN